MDAISRPTITDDDGSGTTGTILDAAWLTNFEDRLDAALGVNRYTTTATGTQNNWDIDTANSGTKVGILRCNNASALTINGITAPSTHRALWILAVNNTVTLAYEAAGSTAANRILTQGSANVSLTTGGAALLVYDVTSTRWRVASVIAAHASTHQSGGSDPIKLDDLAAPDDNTDLNVSTSAHGLAPKISGSDGYVLTKSGTAAVWSAVSSGATSEQTTTATGNQDDFAITNSGLTILRCTGAAPVFRGFKVAGTTPTAGDRVLIVCLGTTAKVAHQDTNSTAAYRLITPSANGQIVGVNGMMLCEYDGTTGRWREFLLDPGAPIDHTFAAGDYTANNSMTWTVAAGDVAIDKYVQRGASLTLFFTANTTTVGGTPSSELRKAIPGGFTAATGLHQCPDMTFYDNNVWASVRISINTTQSNAYIRFNRNDGANFAASTDLTYVYISSWTFPIT